MPKPENPAQRGKGHGHEDKGDKGDKRHGPKAYLFTGADGETVTVHESRAFKAVYPDGGEDAEGTVFLAPADELDEQ
jgi:hypothetical protein